MKTIKIMTNNLKNKSAPIIMTAILFAMIVFTMTIASGCCGFGWACGPGYYYRHDNGWHGNNGQQGDNGRYRGGQQGDGH